MNCKELRLGLDIGTNDVGWALLDENNELIKKNGFTFWGVRMFEEAKTASDRRINRNSRRRIKRCKERIMLLQELFKKEIDNVDTTFFQRLEDSFYKQEDKQNANYYNLFVDGYTDKDYFNEYPTIYHLRKSLIENDKKVDIRLLYLAIHNIIKFRGNFLIPGDEFKESNYQSIKEKFKQLNDIIINLKEQFEEDEFYTDEYFTVIDDNLLNDKFFNELKELIISKKSIKDKKKDLLTCFGVPSKSLINEAIIPFLSGTSKINVSSLLLVKSQKYEKCEIEISSEGLINKIDEIKGIIPELSELLDFYISLKEIIDFYFVIKLLDKYKFYSDAMVGIYNEHQNDLKHLKSFIKKYLPNEYNNVFRKKDKKINNYPHYVGVNNVKGNLERFGHCTRSDFYKYLEEIFKKIENVDAKEEIEYFKSKIENNEFLLRQNSDQNGSFPMQLHLYELKEILKNQSNYYPFLNEISDGLKTSEKIISIFKHKIPYYVGPLNTNSKFSWVKRTDEKIYPWNFEKVVDSDETAVRFITRMQNKCTYLKGDSDYCLPKKSIIFSEYNCLSYLNKININGAIIPIDIKNSIFENVFLKIKKPTKKDIINYIVSNFGFDPSTTNGKSLPDVTCDMSSYIIFKEIFGPEFENNIDMIENIIRDITIFEDKSILEKRLFKVYNLKSEQVKQIKNLNYKGYSRVCNKLLNELPVTNAETGEKVGTVLDVMRNTNMNLQEILFSKDYGFMNTIDEYNKKHMIIKSDDVEDFIDENISVSPSVKRGIIQSIRIIDEIEYIFGRRIDKYYIECTRTNKAKKGAVASRYKALKDKYKKCKDLADEFNININKLENRLDELYNSTNTNKNILKSDKVYLYFSQLGKCMYTLENIDFDDLLANNKYDIDHIYPQSLIKDDSLSNRVLTNKKKNANKTDKMISEIPNFLPKNAYVFYEKLKDKDLITREKFNRLTKKEFSEEELNGFVNRQLVSTNQAVKGLIETLKQFKEVEQGNIIYSKADSVSGFRKEYELVKSRLANNFHHAHDAYLNVIVGGTLNEYFKSKKYYYFKDYERIKNSGNTLNPDKIMKRDSIVVDDKEIWNKNKMIVQIKHDLYERYDVHETTRAYCKNDMFNKVTIVPADEVKNNVPIKTSDARADMKKYGGVTSYSYSKYIIIKIINKKKEIEYQLIPIPKPFVEKENEYLRNIGYSNFEIAVKDIKINTVVEYDSLKYCITGVSSGSFLIKNCKDRYFNYKSMSTIKKIEKYFDNLKLDNKMDIQVDSIIIAQPKNDECKEIKLSKEELIDLLFNIKKIYSKYVYDYSVIKGIINSVDDNVKNFCITDLVILIDELLKILKTNSRESANLQLIGMPKNSGILTMGKTLKKGMRFIIESPTGYYKKVLFEVK